MRLMSLRQKISITSVLGVPYFFCKTVQQLQYKSVNIPKLNNKFCTYMQPMACVSGRCA